MSILIPVTILAQYWNPINGVWAKGTCSKRKISNAIKAKRFVHDEKSNDHAARVAYFVQFGWDDPIQIDVCIPSLGYHTKELVTDGNHRLAAAIYRGDKKIVAEISGDINDATEMFGVECDERKIK